MMLGIGERAKAISARRSKPWRRCCAASMAAPQAPRRQAGAGGRRCVKPHPGTVHRTPRPARPARCPSRARCREPYPFETVQPVREGFVERDGVKIWYAAWGDSGPWIAFAPPFQIVHSADAQGRGALPVAALPRHHDGRARQRPLRPAARARTHTRFDHFYADFVAVLDAVGVDRAALVGISAAAMTVLRLAAEQPRARDAPGHRRRLCRVAARATRSRRAPDAWKASCCAATGPATSTGSFGIVFSEPHSTKPYEDGVRYGWATSARTVTMVPRTAGSTTTCASSRAACAARRS